MILSFKDYLFCFSNNMSTKKTRMIELIACLSCGFFVAGTIIFLIGKKRREKNKTPSDMIDLDHY